MASTSDGYDAGNKDDEGFQDSAQISVLNRQLDSDAIY